MIYTDGFNLALIPLVDSGNSEDSVDEKLSKGFFERKISGSKRRESERLLKTRYLIFIQLNGLNNKSNYKNRKTNYTEIKIEQRFLRNKN